MFVFPAACYFITLPWVSNLVYHCCEEILKAIFYFYCLGEDLDHMYEPSTVVIDILCGNITYHLFLSTSIFLCDFFSLKYVLKVVGVLFCFIEQMHI